MDTKKINWKRGFARISGIASILIFVGVVIWMLVDPEYTRSPGARYYEVYEILDEPEPEPDILGDFTSLFSLGFDPGRIYDPEKSKWIVLSAANLKFIKKYDYLLVNLPSLEDKYPEPDYKIWKVAEPTRYSTDIWATAVRALLALIPWGLYLLVWVLIIILKDFYRFVARGFKGS